MFKAFLRVGRLGAVTLAVFAGCSQQSAPDNSERGPDPETAQSPVHQSPVHQPPVPWHPIDVPQPKSSFNPVQPSVPGVATTARRPDPPAVEIAAAMEIRLEDRRWQSLPKEIDNIWMSPDHRLWYSLVDRSGFRGLPAVAVKQVVEREFRKPAPQLQGVSAIFFESLGTTPAEREQLKRLWVVCQSRTLLLGYDGSQWIERQIPESELHYTHGASRSFFQLADSLVFFTTSGCHVLRDGQWNYQDLQEKSPLAPFRPDAILEPRAWIDPDGKGLLILVDVEKGALWHYRDGVWKRTPWQEPFYRVVPVRPGENLIAVPSNAISRSMQPHDAKSRVAVSIDPDGNVTNITPAEMLTIGRYRVSPFSEFTSDCDGVVYGRCSAAAEGDKSLGPGVLVFNPQGRSTYSPSLGRWSLRQSRCRAAQSLAARRQAGLDRRRSHGHGKALVGRPPSRLQLYRHRYRRRGDRLRTAAGNRGRVDHGLSAAIQGRAKDAQRNHRLFD